MKVIKPPYAAAAIRTLNAEDRQKISAWFAHLENWENDEQTRTSSMATAEKDVHVLNTADDIRIFFKLDQDAKEITILDIAKPSRFKNVKVKAVTE